VQEKDASEAQEDTQHHSNTRATCRHAALLEEALLRRAGYTPREHHHPPTHTHTDTKAHKHTHTHKLTHTAAQSTSPLIEDREEGSLQGRLESEPVSSTDRDRGTRVRG
jgi:hypothetical protein